MSLSAVAFPPEVIERIVEEAHNDNLRDDGAWDNTGALPKGFLRLAHVAKSFIYPVRRALYEDLQIEGGERFLMMVSQLRLCPHLAGFVRSAKLISACKQRQIGGMYYGYRRPPAFAVSDMPMLWFLEACPRLYELEMSGPDFIPALSSRPVARCDALRRITKVRLLSCDHDECEARLAPGWLAPILQFPALKELELWAWTVERAAQDVPPGCSSCTSLDICTIITRVATPSVVTLVKAMRRVEELFFEMPSFANGGLKRIVLPVAKTLRTLVLSDHTASSTPPGRDAWGLEDVVQQLIQLEVLALNGIAARPSLFERLPPKLKHLRLTCLDLLPATALIDWLLKRFQHKSLRILELQGVMKKTASAKEEALPQQMQLIESLCARHGLEWRYSDGRYGFDEDDADYDGPDFSGSQESPAFFF